MRSPLGRMCNAANRLGPRPCSGDRDDLKPGVGDRSWSSQRFGGNASAWPAARLARSASPNGQERPASDVVVTNHALLAIDAVAERRHCQNIGCWLSTRLNCRPGHTSVAGCSSWTPATLGMAATRITRLVDPQCT